MHASENLIAQSISIDEGVRRLVAPGIDGQGCNVRCGPSIESVCEAHISSLFAPLGSKDHLVRHCHSSRYHVSFSNELVLLWLIRSSTIVVTLCVGVILEGGRGFWRYYFSGGIAFSRGAFWAGQNLCRIFEKKISREWEIYFFTVLEGGEVGISLPWHPWRWMGV